MKEAIESLQSYAVREEIQLELEDLETATRGLGESLNRMAMAGGERNSPIGNGPGLVSIPTNHKTIFNHSRKSPQARWMWITKTSTVDEKGNLGFPASAEEIKKFGYKARKVFLRPPPSKLQESSAWIVVMSRENHPPRPWKRRGDEEFHRGRSQEEWDL
jgi:hypothetical protein